MILSGKTIVSTPQIFELTFSPAVSLILVALSNLDGPWTMARALVGTLSWFWCFLCVAESLCCDSDVADALQIRLLSLSHPFPLFPPPFSTTGLPCPCLCFITGALKTVARPNPSESLGCFVLDWVSPAYFGLGAR